MDWTPYIATYAALVSTLALVLQRVDQRRAHKPDVEVVVNHVLGYRGSYPERDSWGHPKYLVGVYELEIAAINRGPDQCVVRIGLLDEGGGTFPNFDPKRKDQTLQRRGRVVERHDAPRRFLDGEEVRAFVELASGQRFTSAPQLVDAQLRARVVGVTEAKLPYHVGRSRG